MIKEVNSVPRQKVGDAAAVPRVNGSSKSRKQGHDRLYETNARAKRKIRSDRLSSERGS